MEGKKSKSRALLIFGAPCSGKTTFAAKFADRYDLAFYNINEIMEQYDFSRETMGVYVPVWVLNAKGKSRASFKAVKGESFKKGKTDGIKKDYYSLKREG